MPLSRAAMFRFRARVSRRHYIALAVASCIGWMGAWWLASSSGTLPVEFVPKPTEVVRAAATLFVSGGLGWDVIASCARIAAAFCVAALLAIPLGLLMSGFKFIEALVEPFVDFIRYVPVPALVPIFILWTGIGEGTKFLVLFFGTFFQLVLLVMDDADNVPGLHFDLARTLGASSWELFRDVLIPYLRPTLYDRLRVTLGWCWTYLVIAELVAVDRGIGHVIKEAQRFNAADRLFVCFLMLGSIGLVTDYFAKVLYQWLFPYAAKASLHA